MMALVLSCLSLAINAWTVTSMIRMDRNLRAMEASWQ